MPEFTVQDQIANLGDEELEQMKQELLKKQGGGGVGVASRALLSGAEGAILASQGRPISEASVFRQKEPEDLEAFEKKERIKAKIKQEFGGSGGMQIIQLPGGGFAVIPGGTKSAEGAASELVTKTDFKGNPLELEDVTVTAGGFKGKIPKTEAQREREAVEGGIKKGVEEAFKQAEGLKRALKKVASITRQFNEALPSGDATAFEQRINGFIALIGAETGLKENPKLLALQRTAKLQLRAILRDMGEGARLSDQDISQNIKLIEQAGLTNEEREALIATYMQTAVDSMDFRTLRVLKEDPSVVRMFEDLGIEVERGSEGVDESQGIEMIDEQGNRALVDPITGKIIKEL